MRSVEEAVVLVTGSTDGIGRQAALDLAGMGATVLLHGRDREKVEETLEEVRAAGSGECRGYVADLSSLDEVRRLAEGVASDNERLDGLVNNAGAGSGRGGAGRATSRDGHELRLAVNYLAPFLLTRSLLPLLRRAAPSRVVNVASAAQTPIDFEDVMLERDYSGRRAYAQSKLALVMLTLDLAGELEDEGVAVNALHPGSLLDTKMVREAYGEALGEVQTGADAVVHLAVSEEIGGITGEYFDQKSPARAERQAYDREARRELHRLGERLTAPHVV
ncbi:MAG: SDR family NAD(P)-dependent oxidoreductase [Rubrobacter sp.]|nr:SDR family NAD(P)-dependent oxidoreductase [Rubrobacter sp.]